MFWLGCDRAKTMKWRVTWGFGRDLSQFFELGDHRSGAETSGMNIFLVAGICYGSPLSWTGI